MGKNAVSVETGAEKGGWRNPWGPPTEGSEDSWDTHMEGLRKDIRVNADTFSAPPHPPGTASFCDQTEPQINPGMSG